MKSDTEETSSIKPHLNFKQLCELQSSKIKARSFIIKDLYKERNIKQKIIGDINDKKHRDEIVERSIQRFSKSPFSINYLAQQEILEHERYMGKKLRFRRKKSKSSRGSSSNGDKHPFDKLRKKPTRNSVTGEEYIDYRREDTNSLEPKYGWESSSSKKDNIDISLDINRKKVFNRPGTNEKEKSQARDAISRLLGKLSD